MRKLPLREITRLAQANKAEFTGEDLQKLGHIKNIKVLEGLTEALSQTASVLDKAITKLETISIEARKDDGTVQEVKVILSGLNHAVRELVKAQKDITVKVDASEIKPPAPEKPRNWIFEVKRDEDGFIEKIFAKQTT